MLWYDFYLPGAFLKYRGEFRDDMWGQRFDLQTLDDDLDMMEDNLDIMEDDQDMMEDDQN